IGARAEEVEGGPPGLVGAQVEEEEVEEGPLGLVGPLEEGEGRALQLFDLQKKRDILELLRREEEERRSPPGLLGLREAAGAAPQMFVRREVGR
ncbi:hypothetical protein EAH_00057980, partial [Eimeria acervulina]